jgi:hypothetical protein
MTMMATRGRDGVIWTRRRLAGAGARGLDVRREIARRPRVEGERARSERERATKDARGVCERND